MPETPWRARTPLYWLDRLNDGPHRPVLAAPLATCAILLAVFSFTLDGNARSWSILGASALSLLASRYMKHTAPDLGGRAANCDHESGG